MLPPFLVKHETQGQGQRPCFVAEAEGHNRMNGNFIPGAALNTALTPMAIRYAARCTAVLLVAAVEGDGGRRKHLYNKDTYLQTSTDLYLGGGECSATALYQRPRPALRKKHTTARQKC